MTFDQTLYAFYCARVYTAEQLRERLNGLSDLYDMKAWHLTEDEWITATEQALRDRLANEGKQ